VKLSDIRDVNDPIIETVWLDELTPEEIMSIELEDEGDIPLLYDDFVYSKYLERQRKLPEQQKTLFKGGQKVFAIRGGKKVRVKIRRRAKRISAKQKIALRKARRRSQTGAAKLKRKRSVKLRSRLKLKGVKGGRRAGALRTNV